MPSDLLKAMARLEEWDHPPARKFRVESLPSLNIECRVVDMITGVSGWGLSGDIARAVDMALDDWERNSAPGVARAGERDCGRQVAACELGKGAR